MGCLAGFAKLVVHSSGEILPCEAFKDRIAEFSLGNIKETTIQEALSRAKEHQLLNAVKARAAELGESCGGQIEVLDLDAILNAAREMILSVYEENQQLRERIQILEAAQVKADNSGEQKVLEVVPGNIIRAKQNGVRWRVLSVEGDTIRICKADIPEERLLSNDYRTIYAGRAWKFYGRCEA